MSQRGVEGKEKEESDPKETRNGEPTAAGVHWEFERVEEHDPEKGKPPIPYPVKRTFCLNIRKNLLPAGAV